jgi:hypothetical protein
MENILSNPTLERVQQATRKTKNIKVNEKIQDNLVHYANEPEFVIRQRIKKLDKEWDTNRTLLVSGAVVALTGVVLALAVNKKWFWLTSAVASLAGEHLIQGWSPPVPILRASGIRTSQEIEKERQGLIQILNLRKQNKEVLANR